MGSGHWVQNQDSLRRSGHRLGQRVQWGYENIRCPDPPPRPQPPAPRPLPMSMDETPPGTSCGAVRQHLSCDWISLSITSSRSSRVHSSVSTFHGRTLGFPRLAVVTLLP